MFSAEKAVVLKRVYAGKAVVDLVFGSASLMRGHPWWNKSGSVLSAPRDGPAELK